MTLTSIQAPLSKQRSDREGKTSDSEDNDDSMQIDFSPRRASHHAINPTSSRAQQSRPRVSPASNKNSPSTTTHSSQNCFIDLSQVQRSELPAPSISNSAHRAASTPSQNRLSFQGVELPGITQPFICTSTQYPECVQLFELIPLYPN